MQVLFNRPNNIIKCRPVNFDKFILNKPDLIYIRRYTDEEEFEEALRDYKRVFQLEHTRGGLIGVGS